jgi:hypothetical protein
MKNWGLRMKNCGCGLFRSQFSIQHSQFKNQWDDGGGMVRFVDLVYLGGGVEKTYRIFT